MPSGCKGRRFVGWESRRTALNAYVQRERWVKAAKQGKLDEIGKSQRPLSEVEVELARVKRELEIVKMERDIFKKATAYFAKESLHDTWQ